MTATLSTTEVVPEAVITTDDQDAIAAQFAEGREMTYQMRVQALRHLMAGNENGYHDDWSVADKIDAELDREEADWKASLQH